MRDARMFVRDPSEGCLQLTALLLLTSQNTALVLLTKFSYREQAVPYVVSTVIACSEVAKLVASCLLVAGFDGRIALEGAFREIPSSAFRLALPSVLYVVQNNLLFEGVRLLSPTVYTSCSQSKILTSAFFGVVLLKSRVTRKQIMALCTLVVGMILVQNEGSSGDDKGVSLRGLVAVFTASITSGFAGAYLEKMYKGVADDKAVQRSIWFRNAQLACFSVPIAIFTAYWRNGEGISSRGVFAGYDGVVLGIIALQAIGGLIVAAVMKYASNVLKCFAVSLSICNCTIATKYVFRVDDNVGLDFNQILGIALVIGSTFAYASKK